MKIWIFQAIDPEVPAGMRFIARIRCDIPGRSGKVSEDFSPIVFQAPSADAAREVAQQWWTSELAKAEAKSKPRGRPKKAAPAPASIDDDLIL